jgi:hypothetical protein
MFPVIFSGTVFFNDKCGSSENDASFDVAGVVAEESSDPACCKNGERCVLKPELLISIQQKPRKKKRRQRSSAGSLLPFVASTPSTGDLCNAEYRWPTWQLESRPLGPL